MKILSAMILCVAPILAGPAHAADLFNLDQRYGSIGFTVEHFGAFHSLGNFPRFMGKLLIDRLHPEQSKIDVEADATSVTVPWPDGTELLRGPDFFDATHHAVVRYVGDAIKAIDATHYKILGRLEIRGISRPLTLDATLQHESDDPVKGTEIADFTVTGNLSRSDFGMTADPVMISDQVKLMIATRIELPAQPR
jgi:polyisoprenoid-binding protein YceI